MSFIFVQVGSMLFQNKRTTDFNSKFLKMGTGFYIIIYRFLGVYYQQIF